MAQKRQKTSNRQTNNPPPLSPDGAGWQSKFGVAFRRFLTYGWDLLGILLFAAALILLLGLLGFTRGALVTPLTSFLTLWFGWGRFALVGLLLFLGFRIMRWRKHPPERLPIGKVIALEMAFFLGLALLSLFDGAALTEPGYSLNAGGQLGWGLAELFRIPFGPVLGAVVIVLIFIICLMLGFRLLRTLERLISRRLGTASLAMDTFAPIPAVSSSMIQSGEEAKEESEDSEVSSTDNLPPAFRKSFHPVELEDVAPQSAGIRSEDLPPLDLLLKGETYKPDKRAINVTAGLIEKTLDEFGIPARVVGFRTGPTVTQFAVEPGYIDRSDDNQLKVRVSQISSLQRDLALALSAQRLRIEAPVPGKSYVGIEIPNANAAEVTIRPLIESEAFVRINSPLALTLGRDVSGRPVVADLATMPHLLIAGTTGSGKSVCITALTACLVMNNAPEDLRLAMIDPKRVELMRFNGLPHLMGNVETDIERILGVLNWATAEMDYRFKLLEKVGARNIDSYNHKMVRQNKKKMPKIVILIDELADLMMSAPEHTEHALVRLAQKARAVGIHLILATQRPSTDVVTGVIKANFPTRISFTVASSIDSRVILDTGGAETLLGKGDMLFLHPEVGIPVRAQGALVSDKELNRVIRWWQQKTVAKADVPTATRYDNPDAPPWEDNIGKGSEGEDEDEALIEEAIALIKRERHASASYFQRQLRVGYPRAARLVDQLEDMGVIGPSMGGGRERDILIDMDEDLDDD